ncbi:dph5, partial [Symbiodinium sp. KB8]
LTSQTSQISLLMLRSASLPNGYGFEFDRVLGRVVLRHVAGVVIHGQGRLRRCRVRYGCPITTAPGASFASSLATASRALKAKADMAARIIEAEVVQLRFDIVRECNLQAHEEHTQKTRSLLERPFGAMVLWMIGLGLGDEGDISVKGLKAVQQSAYIYLEAYTSILPGLDRETLAAAYGVPEILEADRELVESGCEEMLERAKDQEVCFLVVGDPLCATTHTDLWLRARQREIPVRVIHNASVMNAVASCGLQLYRFGETVSIPFWQDGWRPDSWYDKILKNKKAGLHTLCLLDIKVKEQSVENLMRGRKVYEPPRFMTVSQALEQLVEVEKAKAEGVSAGIAFGLARLGREDQVIRAGPVEQLAEAEFGGPLHSLVICADDLHELEQEFVKHYQPLPSSIWRHWRTTRREPAFFAKGPEEVAAVLRGVAPHGEWAQELSCCIPLHQAPPLGSSSLPSESSDVELHFEGLGTELLPQDIRSAAQAQGAASPGTEETEEAEDHHLRHGLRCIVDLGAVKKAVADGQELSLLRDDFGNSLLDAMICWPSSHLLKDDWPQFLETVQLLVANGVTCQVRMHKLLGFGNELSDRLNIDKLQIALHAGLRDKFKEEALQQFQHEQRGPFPASLETCLLRRVVREFPREQLLRPVKLQCLEVVKLLLGMNTRTAINMVRNEIHCMYLRMRHLPWLLSDYALDVCDARGRGLDGLDQSASDSKPSALSIWAAQMEMVRQWCTLPEVLAQDALAVRFLHSLAGPSGMDLPGPALRILEAFVLGPALHVQTFEEMERTELLAWESQPDSDWAEIRQRLLEQTQRRERRARPEEDTSVQPLPDAAEDLALKQGLRIWMHLKSKGAQHDRNVKLAFHVSDGSHDAASEPAALAKIDERWLLSASGQEPVRTEKLGTDDEWLWLMLLRVNSGGKCKLHVGSGTSTDRAELGAISVCLPKRPLRVAIQSSTPNWSVELAHSGLLDPDVRGMEDMASIISAVDLKDTFVKGLSFGSVSTAIETRPPPLVGSWVVQHIWSLSHRMWQATEVPSLSPSFMDELAPWPPTCPSLSQVFRHFALAIVVFYG